MDSRVLAYTTLIREFLDRRMAAAAFETTYLKLFKNEAAFLSESDFQVLDELFGNVDAYCPNPELRVDDSLDEDQLRIKCAEALQKLVS